MALIPGDEFYEIIPNNKLILFSKYSVYHEPIHIISR